MHQQRRVRIKDIATLAGVSIGTVDRVLHNRGEVNEETRDRILSLVKRLDYTPNLIAKSLSLKRRFNISILLPDAGDTNPYWNKPLEGIQRAMAELKDFNAEISVFYFDSGEESSFGRQFEIILSKGPDGIILAPHFHKTALRFIRKCEKFHIPFICIDTYLEVDSRLAFFGQDAFQSGYVAAKLVHYGLSPNSSVLILNLARNKAMTTHMERREQGFLEYFKTQLTQYPVKTISRIIDISLKEEPGKSIQSIFSLHPDIAGIFITNSRSHKVAQYLYENNISNMILAGYDLIDENLEFIQNGTIDFLICQKPEEQGYKSTMAMFNFLLTGKYPDKINYSPIDIVIKENTKYYRNINPYRT